MKRAFDEHNPGGEVVETTAPSKATKVEPVPSVRPDASVEAVCEWLATVLPDCAEAQAAARDQAVNGSSLLALDKQQTMAIFSKVKMGPRAKLYNALERMRAASPPAPLAAPGGDAAGELDCELLAAGASGADAELEVEPEADEVDLDDPIVSRQTNAQSDAVGRCIWVVKKLRTTLAHKSCRDWAPGPTHASRLASLDELEKRLVLPRCSIVVVGVTGAGKSTLLNSLIGELDVLPTSGIRACTACLIELNFDHDADAGRGGGGASGSGSGGGGTEDADCDGDAPAAKPGLPGYRGEIAFISRAEWLLEFEMLLDDLSQQDGRVALHAAEGAHNYKSWCKLFSVYGKAFTHSAEWDGTTDASGRRAYRNPTRASLRAKLLATEGVTSYLGRTVRVRAAEPRAFRKMVDEYTDSADAVEEGALWPLVKQVRLYSARWRALRAGTVLIDAPGLNDDNAARDCIVKAALRDADSVWICSNAGRAVNDRTAHNLLNDSFGRQLLMDGQLNELVFVVTQTDVLTPREVRKQLRLPADASRLACARARNVYAKQQIGEQFYAGLRAMALASGADASEASAAAVRAAHAPLPVYCVSARDYQRLARLDALGERAGVWTTLAETEVPQLRRLAGEITLRRRRAAVQNVCDDVARLCAAVRETAGQTTQSGDQATARADFDAEAAATRQRLDAIVDGFGAALRAQLGGTLAPQLRAGALDAASAAAGKCRGWGLPPALGGMCWSTYKATCRRNGEFRTNMNAELAELVLAGVATQWQAAFSGALPTLLGRTLLDIQKAVSQFDAALLARRAATAAAATPHSGASCALVVRQAASGSEGAALAAAVAAQPALRGVESRLRAVGDSLVAGATEGQREIHRLLEPALKAHMGAGYAAANAEAGTGSHNRRKALLEAHVQQIAPTAFGQATDALVAKLDTLSDAIVRSMRDGACARIFADLEIHYSVLWDSLTQPVIAARNWLVAPVNDCVVEAGNAQRVLAEAAAAAGKAPIVAGKFDGGAQVGASDDDELVDVTAQMVAAKAAKRLADMIDLDNEPDIAPEALSGGGGGGAGIRGLPTAGTGVVKPEP